MLTCLQPPVAYKGIDIQPVMGMRLLDPYRSVWHACLKCGQRL